MKSRSCWLGRALFVILVLPALVVPAAAAPAPQVLSLEASIKLALDNNLAVKGAQAQRESAVATVEEAKASALPKVTGTGGYTHASDSPYGTGDPYDNYEIRLSVSQPIYTGGALPAALRAANAGLSAADLDLESRRQEVAIQVASAYYSLLAGERMVSIAQEAVANAEAHLKVVKASFDAGTILKTDVLRTEVAVGQARQNLIKANNGRELARLAFLMATGLPADVQPRLAEPASGTVRGLTTTVDEDVKTAFAKRPDLASAREQIVLGQAGIAQAKSSLLPGVAVILSDDVAGGEVDEMDNTWSVMLNASMDIFDWGGNKARLRKARENQTGLELRVKAFEDEVRLEVSQARQAVQEAAERIPVARNSEQQAAENLTITQVRYDAGLATTVDVLDSQMLLTESEAATAQAVYDYNLALARLAKATGQADLIK